jgi:very-short-patch-repair endonuclease
MDRYIIDFVSYEKKLVIELDGGQHVINNKKDKERDEWFQSQGYEVYTPHPTSPARGEEK